ncbi:arginine--tRNA ligase [Methanimicrococcus blatticola]|uniref:Arginine--tRNA ligase n=1 Tax=Methanimicrococcus blatticola TaxID=91560 RepID=A0A484F5P3_9EURY|nr:arginine--tRNA ligase [Methanimicrococcus blatticola]MBZ3935701.1 arginine--tRNA ligase [Methanimicrococcus blatticola]MCC2508178.1 arginine--tRNA ligase [Methanimicrococcus blatticola]TDQ68745.1 arginyl-tRNA synthetase [Methanimicrococcus blatticola]
MTQIQGRVIFLFIEFKNQVQKVLIAAAVSAGYDIKEEEMSFEVSEHADLATRLAFQLMAQKSGNPAATAKEIVDAISADELKNADLVGKITTQGPYINIFVSDKYLTTTVENVVSEKENYGSGKNTGKILLEHTSANPNGPLHVGHIRNAILGDTLSRILKKAGYDVEVQYYVNDIGRQIAVVSWAASKYPLDMEKKPDYAIVDVYVKANEDIAKDETINEHIEALMKKVENGDKETIESFTGAVDMAVAGISETLLLMNVKHDKFVRESQFIESGAVWDVIDRLDATGKTKDSDGALVVDLSEYGFEKTLVIRRSNGTSLYTTRDLAYHEWKAPQCDRMIDVFGADHKLISGQLRAALQLLGDKTPEVVIFEFVSLPEGSMSTRRGVFITADDLLKQMIDKAYEEIDKRRPEESEEFKKKVARMVGIGSTRYDIIKVSSDKSTVFDWKTALDFEKQGAPFIQYAHARASNILTKAVEDGTIGSDGIGPGFANYTRLIEPQEAALIKKIARFEQLIEESAASLKPHTFAIYARELADSFSQFYRYVPVLNVEDIELKKARLALVYAGKTAIANALSCLGIDAPESM